MLLIALVILGCIAIGAASERRWSDGSRRLARLGLDASVYVILPVVIFFTVTHVRLTAGVGAGLAFGWAERLTAMSLAWLIGARLLRLPRPATGAVMIAAGLANTGYLGVPIITATLAHDQPQATAFAITYDVAISAPVLLLLGFGVGAAFGTKAGVTVGERVRAFIVRNPPLVAFVLALVAPQSWSPGWARDAAEIAVLGLAPIGFFALGVYLMEEQEGGTRVFPPPLTAPVGVALGLRLLVAPAVMFGLSRLVSGVPDAFLIQAGMACGINGLAVAHLYGLDMRIVAGAVAWSTAIVLAVAGVVSL